MNILSIIFFILVVRGITINFTQKIDMQLSGVAFGITKLRNEIYVLSHRNHLIRVYEDREPFRLKKDMEIEEIKSPTYIVASEMENCVYVNDYKENCVWKITRETDDQHKIIKWLRTDYSPRTLSVSKDGELLIINQSSQSLMIYGSDAELIRSIPLTKDIEFPLHAVETSIGNFIISHINIMIEEKEEEDGEKDEDEEEDVGEDVVVVKEMKNTKWLESKEGKGGSNRRIKGVTTVISDSTRDGQMVTRRFVPSGETLRLDGRYLLIDSDDRVFLSDEDGDTVILLDSDLKWNRILCQTKEEKEEQILFEPWKLFYDEATKQLIVGGYWRGYAVNVYTLSLN